MLPELREQLRRNRGGEATILTRDGNTASGHVYNTVESDVILVEDPGSMTGVHVIPLERIEHVKWGKVPLIRFP